MDDISSKEPTETVEFQKLRKRILDLEGEKAAYQDAFKRILATHEIALEEVERLKEIVDARDDDQRMLFDEIHALNHQVEAIENERDFKQTRIESQNIHIQNLERRAGFLDTVIGRLNAVVHRYEAELQRREAHMAEMVNSEAWKLARKRSKTPIDIPLDLEGLPDVPDPVEEPGYLEEKVIQEFQPMPEFERSYKDSRQHSIGWLGAIEAPKSLCSHAVGQKVSVSGWCLDPDGKAAAEVWGTRGGETVPFAYGIFREDVMDKSGGDALALDKHCGFSGEVTTGPGENFIEIHARFEDGREAIIGKRIIVNLGIESTPKRALDDDYQVWMSCFDELSPSDLEGMKAKAQGFELKPKISILVPVYNTEAKWLTQVIESVRNQVYENWELCLADDASPAAHVAEVLRTYEQIDERIKVVYRESNGHIAAATNSALEIATGEFCALLDHDDLLPVHALHHVVESINTHPEAHLFFSDEDKIDENGRRFDPYFKSDWNLDLFLSHNCISHLGVYRTAILREISGFDESLSGSQDWDLALRFLRKIDTREIVHIPKVLYHWRYLDTSTSKSIDTKPYAVDAGKRAIERFLDARDLKAEVLPGLSPGSYRVRYEAPEGLKASIIIPTRDQKEVTERCISSILQKTSGAEYEILLVDNQSAEADMLEYMETLSTEDRVTVVKYDQPFNFSAINNFTAEKASGDILVFLNNDVEVIEEEWLSELVAQCSRPDIGVAGGWLLFPDHTVQHAGILMGVGGVAVEAFKHQLEWNIGHMGRAHLNQNYSAVTGACLATPKAVFEKLQGFNERDLAVAYNDVDYCLRVQRDLGLLVTWSPYAKLFHHESASRGYEISDEKKQRLEQESAFMRAEWADVISRDPYYNPNLTQFGTDFSLAWPPRYPFVNDG
jgi:glycosyltransferase involved in cell wall biosynthesis/uncharacterized coiled-coil protein SlyX